MSKFDYKKIMPRYSVIAIIMTLMAMAVLGKSVYTMTARRGYWEEVSKLQKFDSVKVDAARGNILSSDGQLMASTLPEYKIFMDFKAGGAKKDTLWNEKVDSICEGLHRIFPEKLAADFKADLERGHMKMSQNWPIWPKRIDYNTFMEVRKLPIFCMGKYKGGFHWEANNARRRPFGTLAGRTVGTMYGSMDSARYGLELSYDSVLRGTQGNTHIRKVRDRYLSLIDTPPIDGCDIVTTIDVSIQDLAERAVIDELKEINGLTGVAIVMEVATGDVKAIVNMDRCDDGQYRERFNHAVADLLEPGSVFKTASLMVALDDGVVDTNVVVNTGGGVYPMHGRDMKDHNWRKGGYGTLTFAQTLLYSSNIGISRIIDEHYGKNPEKFVEGIYRIGLAEDLNIPLVGSSKPRIRMPEKAPNGQWKNWSKTALPWMSIGYETQIPPISTVTFYNAIANNGRMMKPRFVKCVMKDGEVIKEYPTQVLREHICKEKTLHEMQTILEHVVSQGLGKRAGSTSFKVAGKTGTAQIAHNGGYHNGTMKYLLSFAGYFPADNPRYSCIVCLQKFNTPASGGTMAGAVFHNIAEGIMAQDLKLSVDDARDTSSVTVPKVKSGNLLAADYVLARLGVEALGGWKGRNTSGQPVWGDVKTSHTQVAMKEHGPESDNIVPNVVGMGARDAVYLIERRGVKVRLNGRGKVVSQSLPPGRKINKGDICTLKLE